MIIFSGCRPRDGRSARRGELCKNARTLSPLLLVLLAMPARAQERPWEVALDLASFNTYYQENFNNRIDGDPEDIRGNSWNVMELEPIVTYRARRDLHLPFFVTLDVRIPLLTMKRLEIGDEYEPAGMTELTQQEQVAHNNLTGRTILGWEILPFLQPYAGVVRSRFTSERTGQQNGNEEGNLVPDQNQDYTETVYSTHLCFGIEGIVPLTESGDYRVRYDAGYENPQSVFVSNDYYSAAGAWGQGTTGYTIHGRVQLDIPFHAIRAFEDNRGYFTIGGIILKRQWNGDGRPGAGWHEEFPVTLLWPKNFMVEAGGFIGVGVLF